MRASTRLTAVCAAGIVITAGGILAGGPLKRLDGLIAVHYADNLAQHQYRYDGFSLWTAQALYLIGKPWIACLVVGGLGLVVTVRTRRIGPALAAAFGLGVVGLATAVLKAFFPHPSIQQHLDGSYPSGHTGVAVVSAGLVVGLLMGAKRHRQLIALVAGGGWGGVMAWSRVVLLAHWFSDVIAGWCLGMIALVVALRIADLGTRSAQGREPVDRPSAERRRLLPRNAPGDQRGAEEATSDPVRDDGDVRAALGDDDDQHRDTAEQDGREQAPDHA
nr:phosphatase PAP2 family protein [Nocardioides baekrokdamisoli]